MHERAVKQPEAPNPTNQSRNKPIPSRHSLKCAVCNHPDRAAIEFDFLNWRNPGDLVKGYRFRGLSTIYRHAHATGLFAKRRLNLRFAMERIVERVNEVPVTATSVIRAARAIARINDSGEWVDPPSRVIVTHIHSEDSSFVGAPSGTGSQPVDSSVEVSSEDRRARAGTEGFVGRGETCPERSRGSRDKKGCLGGRGFSPDRKSRSSKASIRARQGGEGNVPSIPAHDSSETISRPALIFDDALLDEPSDSSSAELPRIDGKPAPPEVILQLTPEFARCREERRRALEADRAARAASASHSGGFTPPVSSQTENVPSSSSSPPQATRQGTASAVPTPTPQEQQSVASSPSLLPQAAFPDSASSALPHHAAIENNFADVKQSVAMPPSSLPPAALDKPATAKQSPRAAGPPLGSSGSANPPFPFTPEPLRRWKPRRRF
ncbi:MAG TPA: hypothetical protein VGS15_06055 [Candidatus Acidoferrales bacterium]|nr:hypothetical protein [Candidatus Acidoferrales bacterium]